VHVAGCSKSLEPEAHVLSAGDFAGSADRKKPVHRDGQNTA
jgi:hypothetical protein